MWEEFLDQATTTYQPFTMLVAFFIAFGVASKIMPCNPGYKLINKDPLVTDISYFLLMPFVNRYAHILFMSIGIYAIFEKSLFDMQSYILEGYGPVSLLPLWAQAAIVFVVQDIYLYWMHRLFHGRRLWPFHAIHHSPKEVNWHSTYRFHPINTWLCFVTADVVMLLIGFSPAAIASMSTFNAIYSAMVHANLNWTFGPFRYVLASPVFHRWHHTTQKEGLDKNFAPTFPVLDILFGTFHMPRGKLPKHYGVHGSDIPESFVSQMFWPFYEIRKKKSK